MHDEALACHVLNGYLGIEDTDEVQKMLSLYRLLRRLAEIPWHWNRNLLEHVEVNRLEIVSEFS